MMDLFIEKANSHTRWSHQITACVGTARSISGIGRWGNWKRRPGGVRLYPQQLDNRQSNVPELDTLSSTQSHTDPTGWSKK